MNKEVKELEHLRYLHVLHMHFRTTQHTIVTWAILLYTGILVLSSQADVIAHILWPIRVFVFGVAGVTSYLVLRNHWHEVALRRDLYNIHAEKIDVASLVEKTFGSLKEPFEWQKFKAGWPGWVGIVVLILGGATISLFVLGRVDPTS